MPYTTRADGDVLTASSHNANCRDQVISTVTSGTRPSGTEGQIIYETDTNKFKAYNGGWIDWGVLGSWESYTPVITQSGAVTKTVTYARFFKVGLWVYVVVTLAVTGAGTANTVITVSLPHTAVSANDDIIGAGFVFDASAVVLSPGLVVLTSTTTVKFFDSSQAVSPGASLGQAGTSMSAALASGDAIRFSCAYETAA